MSSNEILAHAGLAAGSFLLMVWLRKMIGLNPLEKFTVADLCRRIVNTAVFSSIIA